MGQLFSSLPPMGKSPLNALVGLTGAAPAAPTLAKLQTGLATAALLKSAIPSGTATMGTFASLPKPALPKLTTPVVPALPKPVAPVVPALPKPVAPVVPALPKPVAPVVPALPKPVAPVVPAARPVVLPKRKGGARKSRSTRKKSRRNSRR